MMQHRQTGASTESRCLCREALGFDFEDGLDFHGCAGGELDKAEGAAGVIAVAILAENFMQQVGATVDDEVLIGVVEGGVHAAEDFDDLEAVEGAMGIPDGAKDFFRAVFGSCVALLSGDVCAKFAFEVADMAGGKELIAAADAEIEVAGGVFLEGETKGFGFLLGGHEKMKGIKVGWA